MIIYQIIKVAIRIVAVCAKILFYILRIICHRSQFEILCVLLRKLNTTFSQ